LNMNLSMNGSKLKKLLIVLFIAAALTMSAGGMAGAWNYYFDYGLQPFIPGYLEAWVYMSNDCYTMGCTWMDVSVILSISENGTVFHGEHGFDPDPGGGGVWHAQARHEWIYDPAKTYRADFYGQGTSDAGNFGEYKTLYYP